MSITINIFYIRKNHLFNINNGIMIFYRNLTNILIKTFKTNIDLWTFLVLELLNLEQWDMTSKTRQYPKPDDGRCWATVPCQLCRDTGVDVGD